LAVTHADVVRMWGESGIRTYPMEHLEGLGLPEAARIALGEVGVPAEVDVLYTATSLDPVMLSGYGEAVRFGEAWHQEYDLCVHRADGKVYAAHREAAEVTFVNTDLLRYLEFLLHTAVMYQRFDQVAEGTLTESGYLEQVDEVQRHLRELDPDALIDGSWWAGVIEELKLV
jgi:hypothetical protein